MNALWNNAVSGIKSWQISTVSNGAYPALEVKPTVGLIPTSAFRSAGLMTEVIQRVILLFSASVQSYDIPLPSVSVPSANMQMLAATAAALPELLPPGFNVKLYGLLA